MFESRGQRGMGYSLAFVGGLVRAVLSIETVVNKDPTSNDLVTVVLDLFTADAGSEVG